MITEYRIKGSLGIGAGLLCNVIWMTGRNWGAPRPLVLGVWALTSLVMTYGCVNYIRAKGYPPLLGLPALFPTGVFGLVIACLLPDRVPEEPPTPVQRQVHEQRLKAREKGKGERGK